jgi:N-acetylmuramoyl-L-alanine amidase
VSIRASRLVFLCIALLAGGAPGAAAYAAEAVSEASPYPVATDVRLGGDTKQTRFVVDLSRRVAINAFTLADPYRVVVDLPQVAFQVPHNKVSSQGRGLIKSFRYGLVMAGGSRIVLDLSGPVRIEKAFSLEAAEGQPARLVLDLVATDRESFLRTIALDNRVARTESAHQRSPIVLPTNGDRRPVVVIDPGHGGIDEGTRAASGETEKSIVLEFAKQLHDRLESTGKYRVLMTRSDDTYISLGDRVRFARANKAALFISIHADALPRRDGDAQGASIYTLSDTASDAEAARLADAENRADVIAGVDLSAEPDDVADILIDLAQRETKAFSAQFARTLSDELKNVARLHKHPLKSAGFRVLKAPDVPSVLVELGYVSNRGDLKLITSTSWQARAAQAIVQSVKTYFLTRLAGADASLGRRD